jgi:neutral ceramidase
MKLRLLCLCLSGLLSAAAAEKPMLRAGAARVDITPGKDDALPMSGYAGRKQGYTGIHDHIYTRAIALDDGTTKAAIVTAELVGLDHKFWSRVTERMSAETGIPQANILLAATHTHSAPSPGTDADPDSPHVKYVRSVEQAMMDALRQALANLQPARVGAGTGHANVNVNRVAQMADGSWWLGINPDGPSDKTVAVVKFETASGEPLAIFVNYAVHGTGMGQESLLLSGDVPGATSRWVEQHFGDRVVAPFTSGAAGDQCPIYDRMPRAFDGVMAIGRILGEETIRVSDAIKTTPQARIVTAQQTVSCPGRKFVQGPHGRRDGHFEDSPPVDIRLSLLRINDIALAGVSGEALTMIGQHLKKDSPLANTIMVTHCNGSSGYLPDDAAFARVGYEVQTTRVAPGYAEKAIVNGLLEMIRSTNQPGRR